MAQPTVVLIASFAVAEAVSTQHNNFPPARTGSRRNGSPRVPCAKTAIFFMAFLPQFIDASAAFPIWVQFLILGTIVNLMFSSADLVCVFLTGAIVMRLRRSSHAGRLIERAGAAVLVGLGTHLALLRG